MNFKHPILIEKGECEYKRIAELVRNDKFIAALYSRAVKKAESILEEETQVKYYDEINLDAQSCQDKIDALSFIYRMTCDKRFYYKTVEWLDAICALKEWQTFKFLTTAAFAVGAAIAYDRLYDELPDTQKKKYAEAIVNKALLPSLKGYENARRENKLPPGEDGWWSVTETNWNSVCNSAMICAAVAVYNEFPEISENVIINAKKSLKLYIDSFGDNGASVEGLSYWLYANIYLSRASCALVNAFGCDELLDTEGFKKGLIYAEQMNFGSRCFNFHDVINNRRIDTFPLMYYALRFNMPEFGRNRINCFKKGYLPICGEVNITDIIWYRKGFSAGGGTFFGDVFFEGSQECVMYADDDIAVAVHAGDNAANHGHLDSGTVIVDSKDRRWFCDLGKDMLTYSVKGLKYNRWQIYRMRAEGHNCIVINPDEKPDMEPSAYCRIVEFYSDTDFAEAVIDLTPAYKNAKKLTRSVVLDKKKRTLKISDDISLTERSDIYCFWHTEAKAEISGKKAVLSSERKTVEVIFNEPVGLMAAEPLESSPCIPEQADNKDFCKLFIKLKDKQNAKINLKIKL